MMKATNHQQTSDSPFWSFWSKVFYFYLLYKFIPIYCFIIELVFINSVYILDTIFRLWILSSLKN